MMLSEISYKVAQGICVNEYNIIAKEAKTVEVRVPINHIFCCDISGSMWDELPLMRKQLKNRLSSIIEAEDTITIIAFADAEDCFVLKEYVHCNSVSELADLHKAIDKYLTPQGCTNFLEPVERSIKLIHKGERYNWVFLSDGGHNCGAFSKVTDALKKLQPAISQSTIIEYGYYADSERLSDMAEILGGSKIPAAQFDEYEPIMETVFKGGACTPRIEVDIPEDVKKLIKPIVIYLNDSTKQVCSVAIDENNKATLPTSVKTFWTLSRTACSTTSNSKPIDLSGFYGIAYVLADKLEYDIVEDVLNYIGDKKFIAGYQGAFGKQKLFAFQTELATATFDKSVRGEIDPNYKPSGDGYCVIDFFNELSDDKGNLIRVASDDFKYSRTGAKSVDKIKLTEEEQNALANAKSATAAQAILDKAKERQVKMEKIDKGYPITDFVWNEERANLGGLFNIDVELTLPENQFGLTKVKSKIFRNYTIIKDGIINVSVLPLILTKTSLANIKKHDGVKITVQKELDGGMTQCLVDISALPVINKKKIKGCKKSDMTKLALNVTDCKFCLKYLKTLVTEKPADAVVSGYTPEQAEYLASLGITEKGYSPEKETVKDGDFYMATTLNSAFKGFSSVPKISDVTDKLKKGGKLTPSVEYMAGCIKRVDDYISSTLGANATDERRNELVLQMIEDMDNDKDMFSRQIAQMKFALLVSRKWFEGSTNFDDNTDTIRSQYGLDMTIEYRFVDKKQNL